MRTTQWRSASSYSSSTVSEKEPSGEICPQGILWDHGKLLIPRFDYTCWNVVWLGSIYNFWPTSAQPSETCSLLVGCCLCGGARERGRQAAASRHLFIACWHQSLSRQALGRSEVRFLKLHSGTQGAGYLGVGNVIKIIECLALCDLDFSQIPFQSLSLRWHSLLTWLLPIKQIPLCILVLFT